MPRVIISQDPVTRPATPQVTYDRVVMTSFRARMIDGVTRLRAHLHPQDSKGNLDPEADAYCIDIKDLEKQMSVTPKFAAAWDTINDVMGLAYDFYRLREKVDEAIANGEDASEIIAARNAALAALRASVE